MFVIKRVKDNKIISIKNTKPEAEAEALRICKQLLCKKAKKRLSIYLDSKYVAAHYCVVEVKDSTI